MIRFIPFLFILIFLSACNSEIKVTPNQKNSETTTGGTAGGSTGGAPTPPAEVTLIRVIPIPGKADDANVTINATAIDAASVELFSDDDCSTSLGTTVAVGGTATFNLTLSAYGNYEYYAIQTIGGESSTCSTTPASYTYAPPKVSGLALLSPTSPGGSSTPHIEAQGILTGAKVTLYSDSSCTTSVTMEDEDGGVAELVPTLTVGSYQFYATQTVNSIESVCSTVSVAYEYRSGCTAADLASAPFSRGAGTANDPYIICNGAQFNNIGSNATYKNKHFKLEDGIDLSAYNETSYNVIGGTGPCTAGNYFTGTIDGGYHTVGGLTYNSAVESVGVFGCFNGTLKDISFTGLTITGGANTGLIGVAGYSDNMATVATIQNVHVTWSSISGTTGVGGIVGRAVNAVLLGDTTTNLSVTGSGNNVGGIVGRSDNYTSITATTSSGGVLSIGINVGGIVGLATNSIVNNNTSNGTISGGNRTGGIAGEALDCIEFNSNVSTMTFSVNSNERQGGIVGNGERCQFTKNSFNGTVYGQNDSAGGFGFLTEATVSGTVVQGTVTCTGDQCGGVAGEVSNSVITKSYSSITGTNNGGWSFGGIVGYLDSSTLSNSYFFGSLASDDGQSGAAVGGVTGATITNVYSRGTTTNLARGFLGVQEGASTYSNNYYDVAKAASPSVQLAAGKIEAVSDAALKTQATFVNWNFAVVWVVDASGYPALQIGRPSGIFHVSPSGNDSNPGTQALPWRSLTFAGSEATAGDTIYLHSGTYDTRLVIVNSGNSSDGPITFARFPGETPILDGTLVSYPTGTTFGLVEGRNVSDIVVSGLELKGTVLDSTTTVPTGMYFSGRGGNISLEGNVIYGVANNNVNGNAHGILIFGDSVLPMVNVNIASNNIYDLVLGSSESVAVNGNVDGFYIAGNTIHNNNNIAIDVIGYEGACSLCDPENDRARNGGIFSNTIYDITAESNPAYGGSLGAVGIYVDGAKDIIIDSNLIYNSDYGIELASEYPDATYFADRVIVRNNIIGLNKLAGLTMGGYTAMRGGCRDCMIVNNTFFNNNTANDGAGEIYIQHQNQNVTVGNNIMYAGAENILVYMSGGSNTGLTFDYNLYHTASGTKSWHFNGSTYSSLAAFQVGTGQEGNANQGDPLFADPSVANFTPGAGSPAINTGYGLSSAERGLRDYEGNVRSWGAGIDRGAVEADAPLYVP